MTNLEITRACAEAMGLERLAVNGAEVVIGMTPNRYVYRPLHDDAQAMALVKRFRLEVYCEPEHDDLWLCNERNGEASMHADLNRAICLCVAKMHRREA